MTTQPCPHCPPPWSHEHIGDTSLPLLIVVRREVELKEWHFHGTMKQCDAIVERTDSWEKAQQLELLLLQHKDVAKALEAFDAQVS